MKKDGKPELKPRLRFPEFGDAGGWEALPVSSVAHLKNGYAFKSSNYIESGRYTIITIANVQSGWLQLNSDRTISDLPDDIQVHQILRLGDILVSMTGNVGRVCRVSSSNLLLNQRVGKLVSINIARDFFYHSLQNPRFRNLMQLRAAGGAQGNLSAGDIGSYTLERPSDTAEQQKIADCLTSVDDLIAAQVQKVDALKTHKKGLMQNLFPRESETQPRLRFPEFRDAGGWDVAELRDVAEFVNERIPIDRVELGDYVSTENILPDYIGITRASKLPSTGSVTRFKPNDTLVSNIRPYLKKIWFSNKGGGASNDVIVIRAKRTLLPQYFPFLLKNDSFINYVMKGVKGVKMPRGDISSIKAYPAFHPSKPEQQKVADCLTSVDELIAAQARKVDTLKIHKKGLMQQLFPSPDEVDA